MCLRVLGLATCALLLVASAQAQERPSQLINADFEASHSGFGDAWRPIPADLTVSTDSVSPFEGRFSYRISRARASAGGFSAIGQALDATPYQGKTVRFRAAVRTQTALSSGGAGLWLRVDRPDGAAGFFDNMSDRPIRSSDWLVHELVGPVAADATQINVGLLLSGIGSAWIDASSFEIVSTTENDVASDAALTARSVRNLTAFTKAYGYVRWFSPFSNPADPNWSSVAIGGAQEAEQARSDAELTAVLERWLLPFAPGLRLAPSFELPAPAAEALPDLVRWRHTGVEQTSPVYRSERIAADHSAVWTAELVSGIAFWMPLTASSRDIVSIYNQSISGLSPGSTMSPRASRLAAVVVSWNVFQHFFPGFKDDGAAWEAALTSYLQSGAVASAPHDMRAVLRRMVADLDDGHGDVSPRADGYRLPLSWQLIEGELVITGKASSAPPDIEVGDVVVALDGVPAPTLWMDELPYVSASTEAYGLWRAIEERLWRPDDRAVPIRLRGPDGLERETHLRPSMAPQARQVATEPRPAPVTWFPAGAWYFDLTRLNDEQLGEALRRVQAHQPIIFDLRGYPRDIRADFLGHLSDLEIHTPPFWVPVHLLPDGQGRDWAAEGWSVSPRAPRLRGRIAFLTDTRAISYSETLLAMVREYNLAEIVGAPTAGTNGNANTFTAPGGFQLSWTGMTVTNHDGSALSGHGVQPTVPVARTLAGVAAGRDEVLERAIETVATRH